MKKGDKIVMLIMILLVIISLAGVLIYKKHVSGTKKIAVIKQNSKVIRTIDLNKVNNTETFTVKYNKIHFNKIEIQHGKIRILDADCPDKICVKTGWISNPGQNIACLPHKLIIAIEGNDDNIDSITQ